MLLARIFKPRRVKKGAFWICSTMLVVIFAVPYIPALKNVNIGLNSLYEVVCIAVVFPILVWIAAGAAFDCGRMAKFYRALGDLSYPLYIVHYPIMYVFYAWIIEKKYYTLSACWGAASLVVVSSILLAVLCLRLYDEPVRRWLSKKILRKD